MKTVEVNLTNRSYAIAFAGHDDFHAQLHRACPDARRAFIITDMNCLPHAATIAELLKHAQYQVETFSVEPGEASKSIDSAMSLYDQLAEHHADRKSLIVAVGGGVVGDLAGFVAATYNRGMLLLMVPTTLLAMVDSSVGGKVGVNHPRGKNLIGAFHQPVAVWIDPAFLNTLPEREYRSGFAEVVKYGMILDEAFFTFLEQETPQLLQREPDALRHVIARSCQLKADVVQQDEYETKGVRIILNYGHTFAHAYETVAGYGEWLHGEAVAAGMVAASRLAEMLGKIDNAVTVRQIQLLERWQLPIAAKPSWDVDAMLDVMRRDKKSLAGKLRLILPTRIGHVELVADVPETDVREALQS